MFIGFDEAFAAMYFGDNEPDRAKFSLVAISVTSVKDNCDGRSLVSWARSTYDASINHAWGVADFQGDIYRGDFLMRLIAAGTVRTNARDKRRRRFSANLMQVNRIENGRK